MRSFMSWSVRLLQQSPAIGSGRDQDQGRVRGRPLRGEHSPRSGAAPPGPPSDRKPQRSFDFTHHLYTNIASFILAALCVLTLSWAGMFPWSKINCGTLYVDVSSGRLRHVDYLLSQPVFQRTTQSALTDALRPEDTLGVPADWRPCTTSSPGVSHSPTYTYMHCLTDIRDLELSWQLRPFTKEARRICALRVLELWKSNGRGENAAEFVFDVSSLCDARPPREEIDGLAIEKLIRQEEAKRPPEPRGKGR